MGARRHGKGGTPSLPSKCETDFCFALCSRFTGNSVTQKKLSYRKDDRAMRPT